MYDKSRRFTFDVTKEQLIAIECVNDMIDNLVKESKKTTANENVDIMIHRCNGSTHSTTVWLQSLQNCLNMFIPTWNTPEENGKYKLEFYR